MKKMYREIAFKATIYSVVLFVLFGIVTVLIPNKFFVRMAPTTTLDYIFLILTSILIGIYISLFHIQKKYKNKKCTTAAYSGGIFGFLGFGCAVCNKILVFLLGVSGVLIFVEPYRPIIGFVGVGLMSYAVYTKGKEVIY